MSVPAKASFVKVSITPRLAFEPQRATRLEVYAVIVITFEKLLNNNISHKASVPPQLSSWHLISPSHQPRLNKVNKRCAKHQAGLYTNLIQSIAVNP